MKLPSRKRKEKSVAAESCDAIVLMRAQIQQAQQLLEERVVAAAERTQASPALHCEVLSYYAHAVCIEDVTVNVLLRSVPPVFQSSWYDGRLEPWQLPSIQAYAQQVHTTTNMLLAKLTPADLRVCIDLSETELGWRDATWVLNRFVLSELAMTCGALMSLQTRSTTPRSAGGRPARQSSRPPLDVLIANGVVRGASRTPDRRDLPA
jgi:hypothetical protein